MNPSNQPTSGGGHTSATDEILKIIDTERSRYKVALALTAYIATQKHEYAKTILSELAEYAIYPLAPNEGYMPKSVIDQAIAAEKTYLDDK